MPNLGTVGITIAATVAASLFAAGARGDTPKEKAAVSAARSWLALVDDARYAESWKEAATPFKGAIKQEQWEQLAQGVRKPLGKVNSRSVKTATYTTSVPGAPDGEYVVVVFETSFANKAAALETVTPLLDEDGKWRVSGYFIK